MKSFVYLATCIFLLLNACKKDSSSSGLQQKLQGSWFRQNDWSADTTNHDDYTFTADHKIIIIGSVIDKQNHVRGYTYKQEGTYAINGDSLVVSNSKIYHKGGLEVPAVSDLPYTSTELRYAEKISFIQPNLLHLIPRPCGPAENCLPFFALTRK
jgi:hypothetical protein